MEEVTTRQIMQAITDLASTMNRLCIDVDEMKADVAQLKVEMAEVRTELREFKRETRQKFENMEEGFNFIKSKLIDHDEALFRIKQKA